MKRLLILITLSMALAIGCQTGSDAKLHPQGELVLSVALSPTRVSLGDKSGDGYSVYWNDGDRLVVNGIESNEAMIDADDRSKAQFEFSDGTSLTYPFNITYPHCATTTATKPMVGFSAEQHYVEGSIEVGSAPMCGYVTSAGEAITLKHLAAILHLPVVSKDEGVILDRVVVTSKRKIAGAFEVDCSSATISATESCGTAVTYKLPDNFALSTTAPRDLFVVLPAVEVGDCEIAFVDASGEKMVAQWRPKSVLSKGTVYEFKNIVYKQKSAITLPSMYVEEGELIFPLKKYADDTEIKIMSFNVRTVTTESDPANHWDNRKAACVELIKDQRPSIIGFQEAQYTLQWAYLKEQLANIYDGYGVNRDSGAESGKGEVMGIMYDKNTIEKIDGGTFWLSETPDVPSKGFGASYSRNATWGIFKHLPTGKIFYYINTHLDHKVANAQIEGMKLISQRLKENEKYPLFLTGDLNIEDSNVALDVIKGYMNNARYAAPSSSSDLNNTYNVWTMAGKNIIDHIYCSNYLRVVEYHTINDYYNVPYVSDHYPVYAIIELP